jgi:hypothetical protein
MKPKTWKNNPVSRPAKESTLNTEGDFGKFTELMKRVVHVRPSKDKPKAASSSHVPAV